MLPSTLAGGQRWAEFKANTNAVIAVVDANAHTSLNRKDVRATAETFPEHVLKP